jgi:hypothetical protein
MTRNVNDIDWMSERSFGDMKSSVLSDGVGRECEMLSTHLCFLVVSPEAKIKADNFFHGGMSGHVWVFVKLDGRESS